MDFIRLSFAYKFAKTVTFNGMNKRNVIASVNVQIKMNKFASF